MPVAGVVVVALKVCLVGWHVAAGKAVKSGTAGLSDGGPGAGAAGWPCSQCTVSVPLLPTKLDPLPPLSFRPLLPACLPPQNIAGVVKDWLLILLSFLLYK